MKLSFLNLFKKSADSESEITVLPDEHDHDREQFEHVLESFHATRIDDRLKVLDHFLAIEDHVSASQLLDAIREGDPELADRQFINETMSMFCQFGFAKKREFDNQEVLYEHNHLGTHHDHFICTRCGKIQEFKNDALERLQMAIAEDLFFHPLQHKTEIYGLCGDCMAVREPTLPLFMAAPREKVKIVRIDGSREMKARMNDLGITVGSCLEVVSNHLSGPLVVVVNESRLALGRDVVKNIHVSHSCRYSEGSKDESSDC